MKKLFFALLLSALTLNAPAQYISPFFTSMPDDIADYLNAANRQDLIDLFKAGKTAKVENLLKGQTELKELSDDQLTLQMNESSIFQMKLLPLNDTAKVIAIIQTVCAPACDSRVRFFSTDWKSMDVANMLPAITMDDFIIGDKNDVNALKMPDIPLYSYTFTKNNSGLIISLDAKNYLGKTDFKSIESLIKPSVTLMWKNGKFIKE